jgi:hypothetical protein
MSALPAIRRSSPLSTTTLSDLQTAGAIANLAKAAGLTYLPPVEPAILGDELLKVLQK